MTCLSGNNRLFCLGFIGLGILLILLGMAQVSEAGDLSSQRTITTEVVLITDVCDICHEDNLTTIDLSVEQVLQRTAMDVLIFQRDHMLTGFQKEQLLDVQDLLSRAQFHMQNGDPETARALVQHADQLVEDLEGQARLNEQDASNFTTHIGILSQQKPSPDTAFQYIYMEAPVTGMGWTASVIEDLPLSELMAESMHRRAPPDEDAFVAYNNIYSMRNQEACYLL